MKDYSEQHKKPGSMMRTTSGSGMKEHRKEEQKKTLRILQKESHQQFEGYALQMRKGHATELSDCFISGGRKEDSHNPIQIATTIRARNS